MQQGKKSDPASECLGQSAGGWTTKFYAVVDALDNPLRIILTVGQQADIKHAERLLTDYETSAVIADRGYDADALLNWLADAQVEIVIPAKKNRLVERPIDENLYKDRNKLERYFNMTSDGPRGAMITYNYLNLPQRVTRAGQTYNYSYDARGNKHRYTTPGGVTKYAGGFEYAETNGLKRVGLASGQAVVSDSVRFQYYLKDHLGNVRLVFDEKGTILQQTDYYPFGLDIARKPGMN